MKNILKAAFTLALAGTLTLSAGAAFIPTRYAPPAPKTQNVEKVVVETIPAPELLQMKTVTVTSSMTSDDTLATALYDSVPSTTVSLAAGTEDISLFMTAGYRFVLGAVALSKSDVDYEIKVYGSNDHTQKEWKEIKVSLDDSDEDFDVYRAKTLQTKYRYYKIVFSADSDLTLADLHLYEKDDLFLQGWSPFLGNLLVQ